MQRRRQAEIVERGKCRRAVDEQEIEERDGAGEALRVPVIELQQPARGRPRCEQRIGKGGDAAAHEQTGEDRERGAQESRRRARERERDAEEHGKDADREDAHCDEQERRANGRGFSGLRRCAQPACYGAQEEHPRKRHHKAGRELQEGCAPQAAQAGVGELLMDPVAEHGEFPSDAQELPKRPGELRSATAHGRAEPRGELLENTRLRLLRSPRLEKKFQTCDELLPLLRILELTHELPDELPRLRGEGGAIPAFAGGAGRSGNRERRSGEQQEEKEPGETG